MTWDEFFAFGITGRYFYVSSLMQKPKCSATCRFVSWCQSGQLVPPVTQPIRLQQSGPPVSSGASVSAQCSFLATVVSAPGQTVQSCGLDWFPGLDLASLTCLARPSPACPPGSRPVSASFCSLSGFWFSLCLWMTVTLSFPSNSTLLLLLNPGSESCWQFTLEMNWLCERVLKGHGSQIQWAD